ncbi:hypothetical protein D3C72_922950 [compost metagenome]
MGGSSPDSDADVDACDRSGQINSLPRAVIGHRDAVDVSRHGRARRRHRQADGRRGRGSAGARRRIGEAVRAEIAGGRRIGHHVSRNTGRAVGGSSPDSDADVDACDRSGQINSLPRAVIGHRDAVDVSRHGRARRRHRQADGRHGRSSAGTGSRIGEAVRAEIANVRRIGDR